MGAGAFLTVNNQSSINVVTSIDLLQGFYDNGDEGSDVSFFQKKTIGAYSSAPGSGPGQYIEEAAFSIESSFDLYVRNGGAEIGHVHIEYSSGFGYQAQASGQITAGVQPSEPQASITVTIPDGV